MSISGGSIIHTCIYNTCSFQGVAGALTVLMKDAIRPNLMQTLEVRQLLVVCSEGVKPFINPVQPAYLIIVNALHIVLFTDIILVH